MKQKNKKLSFRGGAYSLDLTAMLVAVLILVNIMVRFLPANMTRFDISASKLYSVTSNTKTVVSNLQEDVTIYWISQPDAEDEILRNLLDRYASLSDHIEIVKRNPDVYPAFAAAYTDEPVQNNSLVVEAGDRSRFIGYNDIYLAQPDMASYSYSASFDGEGAITSAIDYVVNAEQPILYLLEGHGELPLPEVFLDQVTNANMEVEPLSLLTSDGIPQDAACVMIHAPESDISQEEQELLVEYTENGGRLLVMAGPTLEGTLQNLYGILNHYGVVTRDGVIVETDRSHYAFRTPYVLLPEIQEHPITLPLMEEHYYPIAPISQGLSIETTSSAYEVTELLKTTPVAFNKADGLQLSSYEMEEGDTEGEFALAVSVENDAQGQIVWFATSAFLDPLYNAYSSGANVDMTMNALTDLIGESESMAIRSKSLNYNYLTISESTATLLKVLLIGVFPLTYLGCGVVVVLKKRKEHRHEAA